MSRREGALLFKSSNLNDNGQAMFIIEYLTLFAILYQHRTLGFRCPVDAKSCTHRAMNDKPTPRLFDSKDDGGVNFKRTNQMLRGIRKQKLGYQESYRKAHSHGNTSGELMGYHSASEYRDPAISLRRRLMFLSYDYLEDRDRSFGRGAELAVSDNVDANDDIDDDEDEDEDDEPYDDPEEETDTEEDGDFWDVDDGELAENDEDDASNTESSEFDEYVRRARDPNTKKTGFGWTNERLSRFSRSNPSGSFSQRKRQDETESGGSNEEECNEPEDGSGMDGPLQYVDYEGNAADQQGRGMGNGEGDMSMAGVGQFSKPHILHHVSICIGITLCI